MLKGKKILLGISGSIAAYKCASLVRLLIKAGAEVKVIMTPSAKDFVTPLVLSTLSKNNVLSDLSDGQSWANHVMLGRWADVMLIAPLSCNTLAKMANGHCDNLLLAVYLSATCPVVVAPAMDEDMWHHPSTQFNLSKLESYGNKILPVEKGDLASGLYGEGRMAEPENIVKFLSDSFFLAGPLAGKKALVSAGPTYEPIDPVRFIGNHSSGKMGIALASELRSKGAEVTLVLGPSSVPVQDPSIKLVRVQTAAEMFEACANVFEQADLTIMAAAVADYSPVQVADKKIKKSADTLMLELGKTRDILKNLGQHKKPGQVLVGFALETNNEKQHALAKLKTKNADMIVLNSMNDKGAGFGYDTNTVTILTASGSEIAFDNKSKNEVAKDIVETIIRIHYA